MEDSLTTTSTAYAVPLSRRKQPNESTANPKLVDIGMGSFQWKIFYHDRLWMFWMQAITIISPAVRNEFKVKRIAFLTLAKYAGLVVGSSVWPMTADVIGRRLAFNITLLISSVSG
ncbi:hypothetical protein FVEN_g768 [Fusarium venenatum]|nr:hypothetical protein FVEN_g768 [Fusarium venenatum]